MNSITTGSIRAAWTAGLLMVTAAGAGAGAYTLPVDCARAGVTCLVQQYPDMDAGPDAADPFCGSKTYDGHDGTDIRVPSMPDIEKGVPVVAVGDGTVLRLRDGVGDALVLSDGDRAAVAGKECGNGMIVGFGDHEVQYCHLRKGSIAVSPGDTVKAGDKLAEIGASGLAQFPHVEIIFRQAGTVIDPMTGKAAGSGCSAEADAGSSLWTEDAYSRIREMDRPLIAAGVAGNVPDHDRLALDGPPPTARAFDDDVTVGWAWFANLQKGDRVAMTLRLPDGTVMAQNVSDPLESNKADYSVYAGRRQPPQPGAYTLEVTILRDGKTAFEHAEEVTVAE